MNVIFFLFSFWMDLATYQMDFIYFGRDHCHYDCGIPCEIVPQKKR